MKKLLLAGLILAGLGLLVGAFAIPALANEQDENQDTGISGNAWEAMHEACETGDWEAMAEAAKEAHGEDFGNMPCHGENSGAPGESTGVTTNSWGDMGDHMGGGMMHNGWQNMHGR